MARILVIDDCREFRDTVCIWIAAQPGLQVSGSVANGHEALVEIERRRPDLILMDAMMPELDGFATTRLIKARVDPPPVVIVTLHDSAATRLAAKEAGADGFVTKSDLVRTLPDVLRELIDPGTEKTN